ncbi:DUF559 domain-containing protein [Microbacterium rhizomatis]|uniref:DUF559 domain-containing protein n=1 Tax=Microbacterium rhizomatis TaxID=1631477 RepID=A0A5J5J464_9MICO|nr:DUF559 domain-containing protein [Microbacterium rhizomatis]KAA9111037.1 DUF559 domain-containing protein [Microbacterium rhizomatis]
MSTARIIEILEWREGVAHRRALIRAGASKADIACAILGGAIVRLRKGVYALPAADPLVAVAARHGGAVACISALRAHGIWVLDGPNRPHVWLGGKGRTHAHPDCRCIDHHDAGRATFGLTPVRLALVQVAQCCDAETFFVAYESAWRLGKLAPADRQWIRSVVPARRRWLVDLARGDADSGLESLVRLRLVRIGISVEPQVLIVGVGRVDFLLSGRLIVEVDGRENHDGQSLRHKDLVRDAAAAALGYDTLRFDYALVVYEWATVERAILARLSRAPHPFVG